MRIRNVIAGLALLAAGVAQAEDRDMTSRAPDARQASPTQNWLTVEPPVTRLMVGDRAPLFSYLGTDGAWHKAAQLLARGPVLLVFGADEEHLIALERARSSFLELSVVPTFVLDMGPRSMAALQRKLHLESPVVADPQRAIAELYNSLDPATAHHAPAFFLLDENRTIRALSHGALPPVDQIVAVSARTLGRPLPQGARTETGF